MAAAVIAGMSSGIKQVVVGAVIGTGAVLAIGVSPPTLAVGMVGGAAISGIASALSRRCSGLKGRAEVPVQKKADDQCVKAADGVFDKNRREEKGLAADGQRFEQLLSASPGGQNDGSDPMELDAAIAASPAGNYDSFDANAPHNRPDRRRFLARPGSAVDATSNCNAELKKAKAALKKATAALKKATAALNVACLTTANVLTDNDDSKQPLPRRRDTSVHLTRDDLRKLFIEQGYTIVPGGKGSHLKLKKPRQPTVIIPQGDKGGLSSGVEHDLRKILEDISKK